uniref:Uncharacterized protein n=1 Tax=Trypanosoma vivax (strain Y486) TaxID=1055687 RepID=G0U5N2_TRYVY|nr:hypothetical protein TVY486_1002360 [Trypanosoma vivax Y486]
MPFTDFNLLIFPQCNHAFEKGVKSCDVKRHQINKTKRNKKSEIKKHSNSHACAQTCLYHFFSLLPHSLSPVPFHTPLVCSHKRKTHARVARSSDRWLRFAAFYSPITAIANITTVTIIITCVVN